MKRQKMQGFVSGAVSTLLVFALIGSAAATVAKRTLDIEYNNIQIKLNGQVVTPTDANGNPVEPFASRGTTYLPVRAVGNALGLTVDWDGDTNTVLLNDGSSDNNFIEGTALIECSVQLMGFYKILEDNFSSLEFTFDGILNGLLEETGNTVSSYGPYEGMTMYQAGVAKIDNELELAEGHYQACSAFLLDSDIELMAQYRRLAGLARSAYEIYESNQSNAAKNNIYGAAAQNKEDCMINEFTARSEFWSTYQAVFQP